MEKSVLVKSVQKAVCLCSICREFRLLGDIYALYKNTYLVASLSDTHIRYISHFKDCYKPNSMILFMKTAYCTKHVLLKVFYSKE